MRGITRGLVEVPARWRRWATRLVLASLVAGVIAVGGWWLAGRSSADRADAMRAQLHGIDEQSRRLAAENARLGREVEALRTEPAAIEDVARDRLGLVYPGELVLRLDPGAPIAAGTP